MNGQDHQKVTAEHLGRGAYLYVRQSTLRQVFENTESTQRQYALRQRAVSLGWSGEQVIVIDSDQGHSGASSVDRAGFQQLVSEVGLGKAGIVMGLEVSRLARNSTDWHRLLEICALTDTLILDEDGLYDPRQFNDRLLLGLKGTMSEAELHILRARLRGGILSKAERGELRSPLPVGFVYDEQGQVTFDPDAQVRATIHSFFSIFRRTGSAWATVKAFREQALLFPLRSRHGRHKGELLWEALPLWRALHLLHNPRYAGAFFFGRTRTRKTLDGKRAIRRLPEDQWIAIIPGKHCGYITWEEYEENLRRLKATAQAHGGDRRRSPPREGPALLQGLVVCGRCGQRMTLRYHRRGQDLVPDYMCQKSRVEQAEPVCQQIPGGGIDRAVGQLLVESLTPMALEATLAVQQELLSRLEEADGLRAKQVERARYEADLARRRFMQVDPANRFVADSLEADWNEKLRLQCEAQEEADRGRQTDHAALDQETRRKVLALTTDFPRLWHDPKTPQRERKRMVRLLLEDVTLLRDQEITAHVRFRTGLTRTLSLPAPVPSWKGWTTSAEVIADVDRLIDEHTDGQIASILNARGLTSGKGNAFDSRYIARLRRDYKLKSRYQRLQEKGLLTAKAAATKLGVATSTLRAWGDHGIVKAYRYNDKNEYLYELLPGPLPAKMLGVRLSERRPNPPVALHRTKEVQYEA